MVDLSVVISAFNEEGNLARCLESISWAGEIIVIDNSSTDNTSKIAHTYTSNVFKKPNNLMLNINKNFGFSKATKTWILSLDADEEIPKNLATELRKIIQSDNKDVAGYWIPRKNIIFGKWIEHGLWWPDKQLRLFRNGSGKFPCIHVHEYLEVDGRTDYINEPYIHHNYQSISQFIRKMDDIYTENEVQKLLSSNYKFAWYDAIRFPLSDFLKIYFAQEGYKDGLHGIVLSMLQAFYSFVVFAKVWERRKFVEMPIALSNISHEFNSDHKEFKYWLYTAKIQETSNIFAKILRKIIRRILY